MLRLETQTLFELCVAHRGETPYRFSHELWRRAAISAAALQRLAGADAFRSLMTDRRGAMWEIQGLDDDPLPLFAAADGLQGPMPEIIEQPVLLPSMRAGAEVVEDNRSAGLSLRAHPVSFLRPTLEAQRMVRCGDLGTIRDGARVVVPGIVLVRQKPGSAKGVMFITIEDETGVANLILWPDRFEKQRRLVLSAGMIACHGKVQREGDVIHVVTDRLEDLSDLLRSVGDRDEPFPLTHGRGDGATHPGATDKRDGPGAGPGGRPVRDIYVRDLRLGSGIKVPPREFR